MASKTGTALFNFLKGPLGSIVRSRSSSAKAPSVFEWRTCNVVPGKMQDYLDLSTESVPRKAELAKLHGFWVNENWKDEGGDNFVASLWEYESFAKRSEVQDALFKDKKWTKDYVAKVTPLLQSSNAVFMYPLQFLPLKLEPNNTGGIYEFRCYRLKPGMLAQWTHRFSQGIEDRLKFSSPLGIWCAETGPLNTMYHIWPYESLDKRAEVRKRALEDEVWKETIRDSVLYLEYMESKLLVGTDFSPLK